MKKKSLLPWLMENRERLESLLERDTSETAKLLNAIDCTVRNEAEIRASVDRALSIRVSNLQNTSESNKAALLTAFQDNNDLRELIRLNAGSTNAAFEQIRKICPHKYVIRAVARPYEPGLAHIIKVCTICGAEKKLGWFRKAALYILGVFSCVK